VLFRFAFFIFVPLHFVFSFFLFGFGCGFACIPFHFFFLTLSWFMEVGFFLFSCHLGSGRRFFVKLGRGFHPLNGSSFRSIFIFA
jgi:hypothetical protein